MDPDRTFVFGTFDAGNTESVATVVEAIAHAVHRLFSKTYCPASAGCAPHGEDKLWRAMLVDTILPALGVLLLPAKEAATPLAPSGRGAVRKCNAKPKTGSDARAGRAAGAPTAGASNRATRKRKRSAPRTTQHRIQKTQTTSPVRRTKKKKKAVRTDLDGKAVLSRLRLAQTTFVRASNSATVAPELRRRLMNGGALGKSLLAAGAHTGSADVPEACTILRTVLHSHTASPAVACITIASDHALTLTDALKHKRTSRATFFVTVIAVASVTPRGTGALPAALRKAGVGEVYAQRMAAGAFVWCDALSAGAGAAPLLAGVSVLMTNPGVTVVDVLGMRHGATVFNATSTAAAALSYHCASSKSVRIWLASGCPAKGWPKAALQGVQRALLSFPQPTKLRRDVVVAYVSKCAAAAAGIPRQARQRRRR